jgi:hypothetical protein
MPWKFPHKALALGLVCLICGDALLHHDPPPHVPDTGAPYAIGSNTPSGTATVITMYQVASLNHHR